MERKFHEYANYFPLARGKSFGAIKESIDEIGLLEPVIIDESGDILDGRNRYRACMELGVEPDYIAWDGEGGSKLNFVIAKNAGRRDMNSGQLATTAINSLPKLEQEAKERQAHGQTAPGKTLSQNIDEASGRSAKHAAKKFGTNRQYVHMAKKLKNEAPNLFDDVWNGERSITEAYKKLKSDKRKAERAEAIDKFQNMPADDRYDIFQGDIKEVVLEERFDYIITDPPYAKEYLPLYETLSERATDWLKPTGLLVAMCGQSYLNEIMEMMSRHMDYYWMGCYYLPGQPTPLRQRQVNCSWKPILIFGNQNYKGKIFSDYFVSKKPDKRHHKWGQSVSGMNSIVEQICRSGKKILDPFLGAGTTAIAALNNKCYFTGFDIDEKEVKKTLARIVKYDEQEKK